MISISKLKPTKKIAHVIPKGSMLCVDLRRIRESRSLGLRECARASGVDAATLSRIEYGHEPDVRNAIKVAQFYEMPVEKIWKLPEEGK